MTLTKLSFSVFSSEKTKTKRKKESGALTTSVLYAVKFCLFITLHVNRGLLRDIHFLNIVFGSCVDVPVFCTKLLLYQAY